MQNKLPIVPMTIGLGVLAVGGAALLLMHGPAPAGPPASGVAQAATMPTPVPQMSYIANRDIPPRTVVTSDMLRRSTLSGPLAPGAITSLDELRGKITSKPIRSGDAITDDSFTSRLGRVIPANFEVPSGYRAVAIYVDPSQTAAGLVDVGDRVDVIATQKLEFDKAPNQFIIGAKQFTTGRTVATDLLVLAVDKSLAAPPPTPTPPPADKGAAPAPGAPNGAPAAPPSNVSPPPAGGTAPAEVRPDSPNAPTAGKIRVLLAAPLETAARLVAANDSGGALHVVIRNPQDADAQPSPEVREYPSHVISIAQPKSGDSGGGGGRAARMAPLPMPELPDVTMHQTTSAPPMPEPLPVPSGGAMTQTVAPVAPPTTDIMVIRGTEKTRVIVPQR